jgi:hypothetical protein
MNKYLTNKSILHINKKNDGYDYAELEYLDINQVIKFIDGFTHDIQHTLIAQNEPLFVYCGPHKRWCVELSAEAKDIVCQYYGWKGELYHAM